MLFTNVQYTVVVFTSSASCLRVTRTPDRWGCVDYFMYKIHGNKMKYAYYYIHKMSNYMPYYVRTHTFYNYGTMFTNEHTLGSLFCLCHLSMRECTHTHTQKHTYTPSRTTVLMCTNKHTFWLSVLPGLSVNLFSAIITL